MCLMQFKIPNASAQDVTTMILNQYGGVQHKFPARYDYILGLFSAGWKNLTCKSIRIAVY